MIVQYHAKKKELSPSLHMHVFSFSSLAIVTRRARAAGCTCGQSRARTCVAVAHGVKPGARLRACACGRESAEYASFPLSSPPFSSLGNAARLESIIALGTGEAGLALVHQTLAKTLHGHRVLGERVLALSVVYSSRPMRGQPAYSSPTVAYSSPTVAPYSSYSRPTRLQ